MKDSGSIGICVIGCGRAGLIHGRNFCDRRIPGAELVALADPVASARESACRELHIERDYSDYCAALDDPRVDAVVVSTPTRQHCEIAMRAAEAGKHILCEKPMAMNREECDRMLSAAEQFGVTLQIGFMRRFDKNFLAAKSRIEAGEIGRMVCIHSHTYGPTIPKPWMFDLRQSNGPLAEVNSHDIDTLRWFAESEIEEVFALGGNFRSPEARESHPDFYDNVTLVARFQNGMQGTICGAQGVRYGYDARCEILGESGLITVGRLTENQVVTHTAAGMCQPIVGSWMDLFQDAYRAEDEDFIRCIRDRQPPRASGRDGKAAVMVVNAGNRSIAERRPVSLKEG
jgi:myo-inositol 2-dehydrogenase/D-chiro-inositol 1-dehydrogenase/scyllo-inositol 2-dehydrogenase (NAD+)